jgi:CHAT domain-containing protein
MAPSVRKSSVDACPDLETLAGYLDGQLTERERADIAAHVAGCETCYFVFTEAAQTRASDRARAEVDASVAPGSTPLPAPRWWATPKKISWSAAAGLAVAATVVIAVGTGLIPWRSSREIPELQALVAAVADDRPVEARLSGGFAYAPVRSNLRGESSTPSLRPDIRIAAARIEKEALVRRSPEVLRALGLAYLVVGDLDKAVPVFEEAIDRPNPDARLLSDAAAAYLARATKSDHPQDLAKALTMADRALKTAPNLAEALFNKAYALEKLSLTAEARQAWQDYLAVDNSSGWAAEARARLRALDRVSSRSVEDEQNRLAAAVAREDRPEMERIVQRSDDVARDWVHDQLSTVWPQLVESWRDAETVNALLVRLKPVAEMLATATGDRFVVDAVSAALIASRDHADAAALAAAQVSFRDAQAAYLEDRYSDAANGFASTLPAMDRSGSSYAAWSRIFLANCRYTTGDLAGTIRILDDLMPTLEARNYVRLQGLAHRVRGLTRGVQGDFGGGLADYRRAQTALVHAGAPQDRASMHALIGELLGYLGESDLAWTEFGEAFRELPQVRSPRDRQIVLQLTSLAALRDGMPEAASYYQRAALANAEKWGRTRAILDGHLYQGAIHHETGRTDLALASFNAARQTAAKLTDVVALKRNVAQIALAEGETEWSTNPSAAAAALSDALQYFQQAKQDFLITRVLLARSRAYLAQGRQDLAEADLASGIDVFERHRASVADAAIRSVSFEQPWDLYTEMIRLQGVDRRQPDRALTLAERSRARTLVEALATEQGAFPVDPATAYVDIPPATTVLYYVALDDRLLIWTLSRERRTFVDTPVRRGDLARLLGQYRSEMEASASEGREMPSLAALYDALIRPVVDAVPAQSNLVVVPDGPLHAVPFAALVRREDRSYIIERHAIQIAPSLTVFLTATARGTAGKSGGSVLVLGNPRNDSADGVDLPEAEAEAREVASLYDGAELLTGQAATKAAFLERAGRHTIVHFAGHAIANDVRPDLSRLVLAGSDDSTRSLFARELANQPFKDTSLVVLAACRSNVGRVRRGEGVFSLARPLLAAGVPTVIASLWDVDDRTSRLLLTEFHRALRQRGSVTAALRAAQLKLLADPDQRLQRPASWAGFTAIGGYSTMTFARPSATKSH